MPPAPRSSRRTVWLIAVALVVDTAIASAFVLTRDTPAVERPAGLSVPALPTTDQVLPRPDPVPLPVATPVDERPAALTALLAARSQALLQRDRAAWLALLDPGSPDFLARQTAVFDNLVDVPLASWAYEQAGGAPPLLTDAARTRYGDAETAVLDTALRYALTGFDTEPTSERAILTAVRRPQGWVLSGDDETVGPATTGRALWDLGPVAVVRGEGVLVLGRSEDAAQLGDLARETAEAIPRVTAVWGPGWAQQVVVVVPSTTEEFALLVGPDREYGQIAAVAKAELIGPESARTPVGDRILINPPNFGRLNALGRRVVLTHEVTHVATRAATGPATPTWLVEGFADYVGYLGSGISTRSAARELAVDVAAGRVPVRLPAEADFSNDNLALAQTYEMGWLACRQVAETAGEAALVALYRGAGENPSQDSEIALSQSLRAVLDTDVDAFTAAWRAYLAEQLG